MTKRLLSILICTVLLLGLCSCGNTEKELNSRTVQGSGTYNPDSEQASESGSDEVEDANSVKVTIPEGYTLLRIAWTLEEKGVCKTDDFLDAVKNYDLSSRPVLKSLSEAENVCFKLEGYLFPATYTFKKGEEPQKVIDKMLDAFQSRFDSSMQARADELGLTVHEVLTIASIIEKEAYTDEQRTLVSSTIHNRLKKGMKLEFDVTRNYCINVIQVQYPDEIDHYKYYYNGYRCAGLIAGPICNPGISSIDAALYPDDNDYLFFVIDTEPPYNSAFAETYEEHLKNVDRWKNGEL